MPAIGLDAAAAAAVAARPSAGLVALAIAAGCCAWLAGVAAHLSLAELPASAVLQAVSITAALAAVAALGALRRLAEAALQRGATALLIAAISALGWALPGLLAERRLAERLPAALESIDIVVTGVVADLPDAGANGLRLRFDVESAQLRGEPVRLPSRLVIGWYIGREIGSELDAQQRSVRAGQRWRFTVRLRRPHGSFNPHGFDHELHLFERGIGATGYVRDGPQRAQWLADGAGPPLQRLRQAVRDAIERHVADRRAAGVLAALAVGDQGAIEREDWQLFRDSGIAHLVAISGLHITMFSWLASAVTAAAWRRSASAPLRVAAPTVGRWGGLAAATVYAAIAGWGVPAQRTVMMLALVVLLGSLGRRWPWPMVLLAAAVAVTAFDPWALLQPGFWLSFVAVGLLLASTAADPSGGSEPADPQRRLERGTRLAAAKSLQMLRTQLGIGIGLAPLSIIFFQQLSVVGLLANLIAIPLVTLLITPLALLGVALPWLWQPAAALLQGLGAWLSWLVSLPFAVWTVAAAPGWAQLAALCGGCLAIAPLPWRLRLLALPLLMPLLLPPRPLPAHGQFEAVAIDVGQGTAVVVRTRAHLLLFDAGPQYSRDSDAGQRIVLPLLRGRGERRIDRLVLSHRDSDHVGGAASVIGALPVSELLGSLEPGHPLLRLGAASGRCSAGQTWQWDGVRFEILHPAVADYERTRKPNAISCVLRIAGGAGQGSMLITGDIERQQELELLVRYGEALRSSVMIAPHHGSRTSSTEAFVAAVDPRTVVFQAGYRNRFGHPAADVVDRYERRGARVVETSRCGAWSWHSAEAAAGSCERERRRRYWHDRPA